MHQIVTFDEYSAYVIDKDSKTYVILCKNGKEIIVDQGNIDQEHSNIPEAKRYNQPAFSPNGNYLLFSAQMWEWQRYWVYDIDQNNIVWTEDNINPSTDFSIDDNNFIVCRGGGIQNPIGIIYSTPSFDEQYNIYDDPSNSKLYSLSCKYDQVLGTVTFSLNDYEGTSKKEVRYSLKDKKVE